MGQEPQRHDNLLAGGRDDHPPRPIRSEDLARELAKINPVNPAPDPERPGAGRAVDRADRL